MTKVTVKLNRPEMRAGVDRISARGLGYAAGYIRKTARNSLRRRPGQSVAPAPPYIHSTDSDATLTNIAYAIAPDKRSAIVGVQRASQIPLVAGKTVPQLIHDGGVAIRWQFRPRGSRSTRWELWRQRTPPDVRRFDRRRVLVRYRPRPFMTQALQKTISSNALAQQFAGGGK